MKNKAKKFGKYLRNPAPFALGIANPAKKRKARKTKRNPVQSAPLSDRSAVTTRSKKAFHHKKGAFLYNPAPVKTKRRKRRKNPAHKTKTIPSMSKKTKRSRKRTRNPVRVTRGRSKSSRRRNPFRSRSKRMRNPIGIVQDIFSMDNLSVAVGILAGVVGTRYFINTLLQGDATGRRMFDLPGVKYPSATQPLTPAQFSTENRIALAFYETLIPALAGYFLRNQSPRFAKGVLYAAPFNAGVALLKGTTIGTKAGVSAFLPQGTRTYIPGVPSMLSGPATGFIKNGAPVASRGMGAVVNRGWAQKTASSAPNPFDS